MTLTIAYDSAVVKTFLRAFTGLISAVFTPVIATTAITIILLVVQRLKTSGNRR